MILPSTYLFSIILLVLGMLCTGLWTSTYKAAGPKWRFELYYYDFAIGVLVAAILAALTLGTLGWDGFSVLDDIRNAGKRQELFGFLAGSILNLGNMMMLAGISVCGISAAMPISMGMAVITTAVWGLVLNPGTSNTVFLGGGIFCLVAGSIIAFQAFRNLASARQLAQIQQGKSKSTKRSFSAKGPFLAAVGGVVMGSHIPLLDLARTSDIGMGPYGLMLVVALGVAFSTFVYNLFFMNLPVQGNVLDLAEYRKGKAKSHLLGLAGGALWVAGLLASYVVARADAVAQVQTPVAFVLPQSATLLAMLGGLLVWKEYSDADGGVRSLLGFVLALFASGLGLVAAASLYVAK